MTIRYRRFDERRLRTMRLVRARLNWYGEQDHQRWTYLHRRSCGRALYYKVWNPTYVRRDNMLRAIESGFYDEELTPALRALLVDDEGVRGYVTAACKPRRNRDSFDTAFFESLKAKTAATGLFNYDVRPHHVLLFRGRCSLIDLEGVYPLQRLDDLPRYHCHFGDPEYERFVVGLREQQIARQEGH